METMRVKLLANLAYIKENKTDPYLKTHIMRTSRSIKDLQVTGKTINLVTIIFPTQEMFKPIKMLMVKLMKPKIDGFDYTYLKNFCLRKGTMCKVNR